MIALLCFLLALLTSPFKSKSRLEAENAALRHQLAVLRRKVRGRLEFTNGDWWFFVQLYRWFPSILQEIAIIRPETLVRWHRAGFRCYWRWKSLGRGGRPQIETELRALIRRMTNENLNPQKRNRLYTAVCVTVSKQASPLMKRKKDLEVYQPKQFKAPGDAKGPCSASSNLRVV